MMAAIRAAMGKEEVVLIEQNATLGRKLLLSGKGRCNITNVCDLESFLKRFSKSGLFLRDSFKHFFYPELIEFFEKRHLKLKIERQNRVFPRTDRAASVLLVLRRELAKKRVKVLCKT
ncbi:MAG: NAD(P)/FAD-dependent oxidoreductase, partial [Candidatus Omnitrophica bacterium]|nr:NAD(P)/FAD-dependent oxidoreductase [Candidatus Omnitrophota bacterium]